MNWLAPTASAAASISSRVAPGLPSSMFSAIDALNRKFS